MSNLAVIAAVAAQSRHASDAARVPHDASDAWQVQQLPSEKWCFVGYRRACALSLQGGDELLEGRRISMSPEAVPAYDVDLLVGSAAREAGSLLQVLRGFPLHTHTLTHTPVADQDRRTVDAVTLGPCS